MKRKNQFNRPADDGAVCEEKDPNPIPSVTIFRDDFLFIANPVLIPAIYCSRVVDAENVNVFDFKARGFELECNFRESIGDQD